MRRRDVLALMLLGTQPLALGWVGSADGQSLQRPSSGSTGKPSRRAQTLPEEFIHEVAPMETIARLALIYGVSEQAICKANGLNPGETLCPGQKLAIPRPSRFKNIVPVYRNKAWRYIVVHHTAGKVGKALLVDQIHYARGFEEGLGYHFLIDNGTLGKGNGQLEVAPRWFKQQEGAHCKASGMNRMGIGIGLVGDFTNEAPSRAQLHTLHLLVNALGRHYHIAPSRIIRHCDVPEARTDCPGARFSWNAFWLRAAKGLTSVKR